MAESTRYHRIVLRFTSPWNYSGETRHTWSVKFSLSGVTALTSADAGPTAIDLAAPVLALVSNQTYLDSYSYYPSGSTVASVSDAPAVGSIRGTHAAYASLTGPQQLEVCNLCRAAVGRNSKGRQVYLRKWVHDAYCGATPNETGASISTDPSLFTKWNTGSGPHSLVPVDPTDGMQPPAGWELEQHLFTHQLRRGVKKKKVLGGTNSVEIPPVP